MKRLKAVVQQSRENLAQWLQEQLTKEKLVQLLIDLVRAIAIAIIVSLVMKILGICGFFEWTVGWLVFWFSLMSAIRGRAAIG